MQVLMCGRSQEVSARDYEVNDLAEMVHCAANGNCKLFITESDELDITAKSAISDNGKHVIFEQQSRFFLNHAEERGQKS